MADGPGGKEVGRVSVRVLPDTSAFSRSLERYIQRIEKSLRIQLKVELDTSQIDEFSKGLNDKFDNSKIKVKPDLDEEELKRQTEEASKSNKINIKAEIDKSFISSLAKLKFSLASFKWGSLLTQAPKIASLTFQLIQMGGAVAALAPAAILAGGAIGGTLKLGLVGFDQAMKDLGDPKAFAADLKNLAPSARSAATAIQSLTPAFKSLRLDVQQQLFLGVGDEIKALAKSYLPILDTGMQKVAISANDLVGGLGRIFQLNDTKSNIATIFDSASASLENAVGGVLTFTHAFITLGAVGSSFLPDFATGFTNVGIAFDNFIQRVAADGSLSKFIRNGLNLLSQLYGTLKTVGDIVFQVFSAAAKSGGDALGVLGAVVGKVDDFVHTASGFSALEAVFKFLAQVGQSVGNVLVQALTDIAPILVKLGPQLGDVARNLGVGMVNALTAINPLLQAFTNFLVSLGPNLTNFIVIIVSLITAYKALVAISALVAALDPFVLIIVAVAAIATAIIYLATKTQFFQTIWKGVWAVVSAVVGAAIAAFKATVGFFSSAFSAIGSAAKAFGGFWAGLWKDLGTPVKAVGSFISSLLTGIGAEFTAFGHFWSGVWSALGGPVKAVGNFVGQVFTGIGNELTAFAHFSAGVWDAILVPVRAVVSFFQTKILPPLLPVFAAAQGAFKAFIDFVVALFNFFATPIKAAFDAIKLSVQQAIGFFTTVFTAIGTAVSTVWNLLWTGITDEVTRAWKIVTDACSAAIGFLAGVFSAIGAALSAAWSAVWGFISGIVSVAWSVITGVVKVGWALVSSIFTTYIGLLLTFWQGLWSVLKAVVGVAWAVISAVIGTAWRVIETIFNVAIAILLAVWNAVWGTILAVLKAVWGVITGVFTGAFTIIKGIFQLFTSLLTGNWKGALTAIQTIASGAWKIVTSIFSGAVAIISAVVHGIASFFVNAFTGAKNAVVSGAENIFNFVKGIPGSILSALGNLGATLFSAGKNLIQGLINGAASIASHVWDAIKSALGNAVGKVLSFLGIHSPSRLFHGIGENVAKGFALGITDNADVISAAMDTFQQTPTIDTSVTGGGAAIGVGGLVVNQTINPQPGQSEEAIGMASARYIGFAGRTSS